MALGERGGSRPAPAPAVRPDYSRDNTDEMTISPDRLVTRIRHPDASAFFASSAIRGHAALELRSKTDRNRLIVLQHFEIIGFHRAISALYGPWPGC
jgi:hypothetical protein